MIIPPPNFPITTPITILFLFFFFNDTATTEIYTLSLHDALPIYWVVEAGRDAARAALHFFGGCVVCFGDGKVAREGNRAPDNREANHFARRGSFWLGLGVSRARICAGLSVVAVDGSAARRRSKYPRAIHDANGCVVLGHGGWQRDGGENPHYVGWNCCGGNRANGYATALDDASAEILAVVHRVLHQWREIGRASCRERV